MEIGVREISEHDNLISFQKLSNSTTKLWVHLCEVTHLHINKEIAQNKR